MRRFVGNGKGTVEGGILPLHESTAIQAPTSPAAFLRVPFSDRIPYICTVFMDRGLVPQVPEARPHAPRLRRAALPVELLLPAWRIAPGGTGRTGPCAGLYRPRHHRRMLALRRRPRPSGGQSLRTEARHRQRAHAGRRREAGAARVGPRELRQPRATHHPWPAQRGQGPLHADARRRRGAGRRVARVVDAAGRTRLLCDVRHGALGRDDVCGPRLDRGRARHPRRRPHAAPGARRVVARKRVAASGGRRRPHACPCPPRAAGHADGGPPARSARRMRPRALSQRRAASALAGAPRHDLSAAIAGRDGRHRGSLHVFARRVALRISGGNRAPGGNAGIASAPSGRGRITAAIPRWIAFLRKCAS